MRRDEAYDGIVCMLVHVIVDRCHDRCHVEVPTIQVGGVKAECNLGRVDATIQRRLTDIAENLIGAQG